MSAQKEQAAKARKGKSAAPYQTKVVYNNYAREMKAINLKRKKLGRTAIPIRTFEEWSNNDPSGRRE